MKTILTMVWSVIFVWFMANLFLPKMVDMIGDETGVEWLKWPRQVVSVKVEQKKESPGIAGSAKWSYNNLTELEQRMSSVEQSIVRSSNVVQSVTSVDQSGGVTAGRLTLKEWGESFHADTGSTIQIQDLTIQSIEGGYEFQFNAKKQWSLKGTGEAKFKVTEGQTS